MGADAAATRAARRSPAGPLAVAAAVVVLDQLTKVWAVSGLSDGPVRVVGSLLELRLTRNPGGAFSLLTNLTPVLAVLAVVMAVYIVRTTRRTADIVMAYSLALVLGGALGNLVDRLVRSPGFLRGEVIDFIKVPHWPTFNVADSAITVGVILIAIRGWKS
ncbi:MAG TPA: signal peptidase II [Acidimicrobiia bacterium]|nr:signal peptidase II [Acidimicrobiia bacterium]HMC80078.1 signal peptidase II [Acidimicrobiia bacterium]